MVNAKMVVVITVAALVILVLLAVAPMIGSTIDDVSNIQDNVQATGTLTFTGASAVNNIVNISTETYTFTNGTGGAFNVDVGSDAGNATYSNSQLVAEITANSTLVTAVDNTDDSLTVTSVLSGTAGNAYGTTDNLTNAAWGATTLTGGIDGSDWNSNANSDLNSPAQSWITFVGLIVLAFLAVIIGLVIRAFKGMGE
ncbi:hypothetical protein GQ473_00435 [archaeon]|nr:hypothetical protein [archaeon]